MELPIFEAFLNEEKKVGLAIVDNPAIEEDFICFKSDEVKMEFNDDKMIIKGPALIPNQLIYRNNSMGQYYVFMSENTVKQFAETFMNKTDNKFNIGHSNETLDVNIIESYFALEGNEFNVPKDSWIVSLRIKDKEIWNKIKNKEFNGFSIEGMFSNKLIELSNQKQKMTKEQIMKTVADMLLQYEVAPIEEQPKEELPKVEEPKAMTAEEIKALIDESNQSLYEKVMAEMQTKLDELTGKSDEMVKKIEEFSAQTIVAPITEVVTETSYSPSFDYLKGVK